MGLTAGTILVIVGSVLVALGNAMNEANEKK